MTREDVLKDAKPILFNTEMVRAILDDRKTETRRCIKYEVRADQEINRNLNGEYVLYDVTPRCGIPKGIYFKPPYRRGDHLYVRETFACLTGTKGKRFVYKASDEYPFGEKYIVKFHWKPSIHMPKEAARIFLRVKNVRPERLQMITMSGMLAEGVIPENVTGGQWQQWQHDYMRPVWDSIIKIADRDRYSWEANPWVWTIEFERMAV